MNKISTPICDFVKSYAEKNAVRTHMPGHKGDGPFGIEALDITEINGADTLYKSGGIIRESEENAAALFGSARTIYSTEGSSLSIRAMLYLACLFARENGKKAHILAGRNAHTTFMYAAAMLDFNVTWLHPKDGIFESADAESVEETISTMSEPPTALYVTSPDYLGGVADIAALSEICKKHGILLLVDNAHGAYTHFLSKPCHPLDLGADMCTDSAHKTLPVLTGGAYLHISKSAPTLFSENAERAMALFASTSPSYLIMQSLDAVNAYIADGYSERLAHFECAASALKFAINSLGFDTVGSEVLKITVAPKSYGYTGTELSDTLEKGGIVCEFCDNDYLVMMLTPEMDGNTLSRIKNAFKNVPRRAPITEFAPKFTKAERVLTIREATLASSEVVRVKNALGRILADASVSCPPAIPIAICGERIGHEQIRLFEYYGVENIRVVK